MPAPVTRPSVGPLEWLRFGPFLAQLVVTRRCNLTCGYCNEFDRTSEPVPFDALAERLAKAPGSPDLDDLPDRRGADASPAVSSTSSARRSASAFRAGR